MESNAFDKAFLDHLASLFGSAGESETQLKWYITAIVAVAGMNYAELIPELYTTLLQEYIPETEHYEETRKIKEALTKVCGIWGAAKTGTATRQLYNATPGKLRDTTCYRANDTQEEAFRRAEDLLNTIYSKIPGYDMSFVDRAAPDYGLIVNKFFYGNIFSFPAILGPVESSACIVSALLSIDCQEQVRNHMLGMQFMGASREQVQGVRAVVVAIAERLGVKGKQGRTAIEVPHLPDGS